MLVEKLIGKIEDFKTEQLAEDRVLMDHYDLTKPHQKVKSEDGSEFAISLPHGQNLFAGAVIHLDEEKITFIDLLPEDVLEVKPEGDIQWGRVGYSIGNMHSAAYITEDSFLIPYDASMERVIASMGVEYKRCERKLEGIEARGHSHE